MKHRQLNVSVGGATGPGTWLLSNSYQKQLVRGGVALIGMQLIPLLANLFG